MSDVFYEAIKKQGLFAISPGKEMSFSRLVREMPVTIVDSLAAVYRVSNLKRSWPFSQPGGKDSLSQAGKDPSALMRKDSGIKNNSRDTEGTDLRFIQPAGPEPDRRQIF